MDDKFDKLFAAMPQSREVIRAYITLQAMLGNPQLTDAALDGIKSAIKSIEDAVWALCDIVDDFPDSK